MLRVIAFIFRVFHFQEDDKGSAHSGTKTFAKQFNRGKFNVFNDDMSHQVLCCCSSMSVLNSKD